MPKQPPQRHDHDPDRERRGKFAKDKGNASHIELEERRFRGGLKPSPELYALAREQWKQLPGSVVRSSMDPPMQGKPPGGSEAKLAELPVQSNGDEAQEDLE